MKIVNTESGARIYTLLEDHEFFVGPTFGMIFRYMPSSTASFKYTVVTDFNHMQILGNFTDKEMTFLRLKFNDTLR